MHLERLLLRPSDTLATGLAVLDRGAEGIVLVADDQDRLVGTLSDGDVRRALLKGAALDSPIGPHMHREFTSVGPGTTREEVLDLMQALRIRQIPIVDGHRCLLGLHLLHEILGDVERPNWAIVMAGGRGSRLRPLTDNVPKPMVRVAGRPVLERIVLHLVSFGIRRIFLAINYLGEVIEAHFRDGKRFGCQIDYLREDRPLGTGGALSLLPVAPTEPFLVMNGDLITQANIGSLFGFHDRGRPKATVAVRRYFHTVPFGCVETDGPRITRIEEKPRMSRVVNAGIYILSPDLAGRVPNDREFPLPLLLEECLARGEPVWAFEIQDDWIDIGQRVQLDQARGLDD